MQEKKKLREIKKQERMIKKLAKQGKKAKTFSECYSILTVRGYK